MCLDESWQFSDSGKKYTIRILANELCRTVSCRYNVSSTDVHFIYFRQQVESITFRVVLNEADGNTWLSFLAD